MSEVTLSDTMSREEAVDRRRVIETVRRHEQELRGLGIRSLALFGSVSRGEAGPRSDVDLLVEFERPVGLFTLARVRRRLAELLAAEVDLVPRGAVHPGLRESILGEAEEILAA